MKRQNVSRPLCRFTPTTPPFRSTSNILSRIHRASMTTRTLTSMQTRLVKVTGASADLGRFNVSSGPDRLREWIPSPDVPVAAALDSAAERLRTSNVPVAFPTETVYGLGADATRSQAVRGIYAAKGRPADNPLIVHVADLNMLRSLLQPGYAGVGDEGPNPIPAIYRTLLDRFWPGPLTILLETPAGSALAPEVTAGLPTFGARMPSSPLARSLIKLTGRPLAAPSANASTRPSPTTAAHVLHDLDGRIELILDGGACAVGVESTVVDGLCDPPIVLRPGGVGIDELRACKGWEGVVKGYKDAVEVGAKHAPRAPGMKYKHYSPSATVVLYEFARGEDGGGSRQISVDDTARVMAGGGGKIVGVIRTGYWAAGGGLHCQGLGDSAMSIRLTETDADADADAVGVEGESFIVDQGTLQDDQGRTVGTLLDINLGRETRRIAQGLFAALRELDRRGADTIFVEGIDDSANIAAAVMNRLRKAASETRA